MDKQRFKKAWPEWEIVRSIGAGSYGEVYEIQRKEFGVTEKAALKVISIPKNSSDVEELYGDGYDDESITTHFRYYLEDIVKEYQLMKNLSGHSNIVDCDDYKIVKHEEGIGWDIFIKMELLIPLPKVLKNRNNVIDEEIVVKIAKDICQALVLCNSRQIVHRDIKPENIFVSEDGNFKLGDFGIAKIATRATSGTKTGTYKYMAPEVFNNEPYGDAADIYSLGIVMYWLLNEFRTPFLALPPVKPTATEREEANQRRFKGEPIPAPRNGSEELKAVVLRACAFKPADRFSSAKELLDALNALPQSDETYDPYPDSTSSDSGSSVAEKPLETAAVVTGTKGTVTDCGATSSIQEGVDETVGANSPSFDEMFGDSTASVEPEEKTVFESEDSGSWSWSTTSDNEEKRGFLGKLSIPFAAGAAVLLLILGIVIFSASKGEDSPIISVFNGGKGTVVSTDNPSGSENPKTKGKQSTDSGSNGKKDSSKGNDKKEDNGGGDFWGSVIGWWSSVINSNNNGGGSTTKQTANTTKPVDDKTMRK